MTAAALAGAGVVVGAGAALQSAAGFGFGLFAIPALLMLGFPLPHAVMLTVAGSALQKVLALGELHRYVDWPGLKPVMAAGLATLPAGLWLMRRLTLAGRDAAGVVVALLILVLLLLRRVAAPAGRRTVAPAWGILAGAASGVLNGLANIGGPPVVLWVLAHRWGNERMRVTTLAQSLVFVPIQAAVIPLMFGVQTLYSLGWGLLLSPLVILGTRLGLRLGDRIPVSRLRLGMEILLVLMALSAARPLWR